MVSVLTITQKERKSDNYLNFLLKFLFFVEFEKAKKRTDLIGLQKIRERLPLINFWLMPSVYPAPAGIAFLFPRNTVVIDIINIVSFCGMQVAVSIFSIFAVSLIQQKTPNHFSLHSR